MRWSMILLPLSACATVSPASFCAVYKPVYTAKADTEETKKQVDGNNAVWLSLCGDENGGG